MPIIKNVDIIDNINDKIIRKKSKKTQIFLYDTHRRYDDFIAKINYRNNGKFKDIPHFIITKLGDVHQLFDTDYFSETFGDKKLDKKFIKIALENLGWLNKNTINGLLNNWIGDPYRSEPHIKSWRNYFFWDKYTSEQINSLFDLCGNLCEQHNIPKISVPSQGYLENVSKFNGIVCKSNFSNIYTDINPSFNFRIFLEYAKETNSGL